MSEQGRNLADDAEQSRTNVIRGDLAYFAERVNLSLSTEVADRIAASLRDGMVAKGGNPADTAYLEGALYASWCALRVAAQTPHGLTLATLWYQAEVFRRMVDGEIPVLSVEEMLGLS